jgi:soluble lytic murein transglycosylase-like protein
MSFFRPFTIGILLLAAQISASAAEIAVLRNGSQITFVRKEAIDATTTRLYFAGGHLDLATADIESFEKDETPVPSPGLARSVNVNNANPVVATISSAPSNSSAPGNSSAPSNQPLQKAGVLPATTTTPVTQPELDQLVREAAAKNRLDPDFVASVIRAESNFKPHAVSPKGARGLMQLMPSTAAQLGVADAFDPKANIDAGTAHLNALLNMYHDDPVRALAAYNAGAHRVEQYHGVPPYRETRAYVSKIVRDFNARKHAQMKALPATTTRVSATSAKKKTKAVQPQQASVPKTNKPA